MNIQIRKAVRQRVSLKLAITGPSGAGKTYGALSLAKGLVPNGRILLVDTENGSSCYYADKFDFDVLEMHAPFSSTKYQEALNAAIQEGYEVIVFDSMSHEWSATGGVLDRKAAIDRQRGEKWGNWQEAKTPHTQFREAWLQAPIHVIGTMRSKMEYVLEQNDKGKQVPRKIGLAPIQEGDAEYEFGLVFDVDRDSHLALASKDRTGVFDGRSFLLSELIGQEMAAWLNSGATPVAQTLPSPEPPKPPAAPPETVHEAFTAAAKDKRESAPEPSAEASAFVDEMDPPQTTVIGLAEFETIINACTENKVPIDKLEAYCLKHGKLQYKTLQSLKMFELPALLAAIESPTKRRALLAHLANYPTAA